MMIEEWFFLEHANKLLVTSIVTIQLPDEAHDEQNIALKWQLKWQVIRWHAWSSEKNHSTINSNMPNSFRDMCMMVQNEYYVEYMYRWAEPRQQWDPTVVFSPRPFSCLPSAMLLCWWCQHASSLPLTRLTCLGQAHASPDWGHTSLGHGEESHFNVTFGHPLTRLFPQGYLPTVT